MVAVVVVSERTTPQGKPTQSATKRNKNLGVDRRKNGVFYRSAFSSTCCGGWVGRSVRESGLLGGVVGKYEGNGSNRLVSMFYALRCAVTLWQQQLYR